MLPVCCSKTPGLFKGNEVLKLVETIFVQVKFSPSLSLLPNIRNKF